MGCSRPLSPGSAPVLVVSLISVGGGFSWGGEPSLCKQQSLNAKIKVVRDEIYVPT